MPDTEKLVTISRLKALLDAYGASPEHWPVEERAAATALIETSAEAHILMEEAAALDGLLDKVPEPEVSAALAIRVRSIGAPRGASVPGQEAGARTGGFFTFLQRLFQPQTPGALRGAIAMAGVLGIVAGVGLSPLVFDRGGQVQQAVATATPMTETPVVNAASLDETTVGEPDVVDTNTASLAPDLNTLSLTGDDVAEVSNNTTSDDSEQQSDIGEFTVAGVPLY